MTKNKTRIVTLLDKVTSEIGYHKTALEGVSVAREVSASKRHPVVYEPSIVIVAQGKKRGYLGDKVFTYDENNYLVLSVPLPLECEYDASLQNPMLVISIAVSPSLVSEVLVDFEDEHDVEIEIPKAIFATPLDDSVRNPVERLVECLLSPRDTKILGKQIIKEIVYRVLCGPQGHNLRALVHRDDGFNRIARVLKHIHQDIAKPVSVEGLSKKAGMSTSLFHQNFKLVTASSPVQYIKQVRLHRARALILHEGLNASSAATSVGYESASQFSREYRRLFGITPKEEKHTFKIRPV